MTAPSDPAAHRSLPPPGADRPSGVQRPKVIYVMGQGKSGSTILGVTLGNCADIFFAGELCTWLMASGKPSFKRSEWVRFWQDVREDVGTDLSGEAAFLHLERGLSAFRVDWWSIKRRLRPPYRQVTEELYRSIASRADVTHVVDTSHLPMRARELQNVEGIDLYLIFLVRDVESVIASHMRRRRKTSQQRKRFSTMNAHLWIAYLLSVIVFLRQQRDRRLLVRHEDFIANPEGILREILDFACSSAEIPDMTSLSTGIPLRSSALVLSDTVTLKTEPAPAHRPSSIMRLTQRPWELILTLLRPAATGVSSQRVPTETGSEP
jgi:hypothetical protein